MNKHITVISFSQHDFSKKLFQLLPNPAIKRSKPNNDGEPPRAFLQLCTRNRNHGNILSPDQLAGWLVGFRLSDNKRNSPLKVVRWAQMDIVNALSSSRIDFLGKMLTFTHSRFRRESSNGGFFF